MYVIYSKPDCVYCQRAKDLLEILGEDFESHDILEGDNRQKVNERLGYEIRTVPQIWHGETFVGGYTELSKYVR